MQDITSISWLLDREPVSISWMLKAGIVTISLLIVIGWSVWTQWHEVDQ